MFKILLVITTSLLLAGCSIQKPTISETPDPVPSPTIITNEPTHAPSDPIEKFLVELTKSTKFPFDNPVKADIFWNEGTRSSTLKTYYGDSFLISMTGGTLEQEKVVADYLVGLGFVQMGFNGSIGDDSRKMGYRKDDMICKTDYDIYPDEIEHHLVVYCTDATKGTLRK
jgi:hypothetical protein